MWKKAEKTQRFIDLNGRVIETINVLLLAAEAVVADVNVLCLKIVHIATNRLKRSTHLEMALMRSQNIE